MCLAQGFINADKILNPQTDGIKHAYRGLRLLRWNNSRINFRFSEQLFCVFRKYFSHVHQNLI